MTSKDLAGARKNFPHHNMVDDDIDLVESEKRCFLSAPLRGVSRHPRMLLAGISCLRKNIYAVTSIKEVFR